MIIFFFIKTIRCRRRSLIFSDTKQIIPRQNDRQTSDNSDKRRQQRTLKNRLARRASRCNREDSPTPCRLRRGAGRFREAKTYVSTNAKFISIVILFFPFISFQLSKFRKKNTLHLSYLFLLTILFLLRDTKYSTKVPKKSEKNLRHFEKYKNSAILFLQLNLFCMILQFNKA